VLVAVLLEMNPRELFQTNDAEGQAMQVKFGQPQSLFRLS
jgi:hypothetical protein